MNKKAINSNTTSNCIVVLYDNQDTVACFINIFKNIKYYVIELLEPHLFT